MIEAIVEFAVLAIFFLSLWLIDFVFDLRRNIATQKFRNQSSWVAYLCPTIVATDILMPIFFYWLLRVDMRIAVSDFFILSFFSLIFFVWYWSIDVIELKNLSPMRFAAGAIGKEGDMFDFKDSAESVAMRLMGVKQHVNVIGIYGFPGFGKSSFARMIIEHLPQEETLYTFISLTETNEAKDFSILFAERWFASLKERYPKFDTTLAVPFMQSILRESGNGILASIFELLPALNKGLQSTEAAVCDSALPPPGRKLVTPEIANVFGNVQKVQEKLWVVMIDEIERARFDEIYRVVEIIERFKNEGRTGMPVRVVFMLCVSDASLRRYLQKYNPTNELTHLIWDFFFGGSKSLTLSPIFLPPVSYENKLGYFKDRLITFNNSLDENQRKPDLENNLEYAYFDTTSLPFETEIEERGRISRVFGIIGFSPRLIDRCINGLYFTFGTYRSESYVSKPTVRMSDLLIMEYVRIEYPHIIPFLTEYADDFRSQFANRGLTMQGLDSHFKRRDLKEGKGRVADQVAQASKKYDMDENEKSRVEELVAFISYTAYEFWNSYRDMSVDSKRSRFGTLSDPYELWNYLHMTDGEEGSPYARLDALYFQHQQGQLILPNLSLLELHEYSRFSDEITDAKMETHLGVLQDVKRRLVNGEVEVRPGDIGDTIYDTIIYDFVHTLLVLVEKAKNTAGEDTKYSSHIMDEVVKALDQLMRSPKITIGGKFIILNSFANDTRGGVSDIHRRFREAFAYMLEQNKPIIIHMIKSVFDEYEQKYVRGNESLYDYEENFFYVMYQGWSGDNSRDKEIRDIRDMAKRGLGSHPVALEKYWDRYKSNGKNFQEVLRNDFDDRNNNALYMPLATLVEITEKVDNLPEKIQQKLAFWRPAVDALMFQAREQLESSNETLRYVLIKKGLLEK